MKKILNLLGTITLIGTSTTSLISCEKPNNNENGGNKPKPTPEPQQPPENSNWKLIDSKDIDRNSEKYYIGLYGTTGNWWFFNPKKGKEIGELSLFYKCKIIYRWDGVDEPQTPTINSNTGEIINWKEQKD